MERDKLAHLGGGLAVAAFAAVIGAVLLFFVGLHPLTVIISVMVGTRTADTAPPAASISER